MSLLMDALRKADRAQQTPDNQTGKSSSTKPKAKADSGITEKAATMLEWEDELQSEPFPINQDKAPEPAETPDNERLPEWNALLDELDELSGDDDSRLAWETSAEAEKSPWGADELVLEETQPLHHAALIAGDAADLSLMDADQPPAEAPPLSVPVPTAAAETTETGAETLEWSVDDPATDEVLERGADETAPKTNAEVPAPELTQTAEGLEWTSDEPESADTALEWASEEDSDGMEWVSEMPATPQAAAKLYQASQRHPAVKRTPWGLMSGVILALLAAGAGGYYFYLESMPGLRVAKPTTESVPHRPRTPEEQSRPALPAEERPRPAPPAEERPRPAPPAEERPRPAPPAVAVAPIEPEPVQPRPAAPATPAKVEPPPPVPSPLPREASPPPEPEQAPLTAEERGALLRLEKRNRLRAALNQGYAAYYADDAEQAENAYRQALRIAPQSRQALLGLAGSLVQQGKLAAAHQRYREVLRRYPEDPVAQSVLLNFAATTASPADESRLKSQLAESPQNAYLHFALGNLFSRRQQWSEAQQAYFNAYHYNNTNPNYAYNLAISLEHLGQSRPALNYYEKALALAARHPSSFDAAILQQRITTLRHGNE